MHQSPILGMTKNMIIERFKSQLSFHLSSKLWSGSYCLRAERLWYVFSGFAAVFKHTLWCETQHLRCRECVTCRFNYRWFNHLFTCREMSSACAHHVVWQTSLIVCVCVFLTDSVQRRSGTSRAGEPQGQRWGASPESPPASRWIRNPRR